MKAIKLNGMNTTLTAPPGHEDKVQTLHAFQTEDGRTVSVWEMNDAEFREFRRTKRILLHVMGPHPAVGMTIVSRSSPELCGTVTSVIPPP